MHIFNWNFEKMLLFISHHFDVFEQIHRGNEHVNIPRLALESIFEAV